MLYYLYKSTQEDMHMKKLLALLLCVFLLTGCAQSAEPTTPQTPTNPPAASPSIPETEPSSSPTDIPTEPMDTEPAMWQFTVYYPNENADGLESIVMSSTTIDPDTLIRALVWLNVLPEATKVNSLTSEGLQLNIDFNETFRDYLCTMGTSGEMVLIGSVVNTFLSAYQAESIMITANGETIESGHVVYDFPIEFID